ncbi:hypothetical protein [Sphingomonas sp. TDK1]|uniref:hypothetical protein n=1 Tax=Sphingomonas sp. TDK1 TaxID=453247 RepID=UPI000A7395C5|nr:hypothetical protein [Sphingomonas sp. TDK1]
MRKVLTAIAGAFVATAAFAATPAQAQTYAYLYMGNADPSLDITISDVSWSGSYYPRIEGTLKAGSPEVRGSYHTVLGDGNVSFKANMTVNGAIQTCYFYVDVSSSGSISAGAIHWTGSPNCSANRSGSNVTFTMSKQ